MIGRATLFVLAACLALAAGQQAAAAAPTLLSGTAEPAGILLAQARDDPRGRRYRDGGVDRRRDGGRNDHRRDRRGGYERNGRGMDDDSPRLRYAPPARNAPRYRHEPNRDGYRDSAPERAGEERVMPLSDIMDRVRRRVPGRVLNAQLHGNLYEIRIVTPQGRVVNVVADGRSGEILRIVGDR